MSWKPGEHVELLTDRFCVRTLKPEDITQRYVDWANDEEVMEHLNLPTGTLTHDKLVKNLKKYDNKSSFNFGIFLREPDLMIGVHTANCDFAHGLVLINVMIGDKDYWGKKTVLEARGAVIDFLFDEDNFNQKRRIDKIWGMPFTRNLPMVFNYRALGFQCEGVMRAHRRNHKGGRLDQYMFGLLRSDWEARNRAIGR